MKFTVNKKGDIRFGLGAIKGLGHGPVSAIIVERDDNGPFKSIFDFSKRISPRECNKKAYEGLIFGGGFDSFKNIHRAQFFQEDTNKRTFLENLIKFGASYKDNEDSAQSSLFGEDTGVDMPEPEIPKCEEWGNWQKLSKEKEVVGIYISGHPLDDFKLEIKSFCNGNIDMLNNLDAYIGKELIIGGYISEAEHRFTVNGSAFGTISLEDYTHSIKLFLWEEEYLRNKHYVAPNLFVAIRGKIEKSIRRKEPSFRINSIELLKNLREKSVNSIAIKIPIRSLDQKLISNLNNLFIENEGNCPVNFQVFDPVDEINVNLNSKSVKIDINNKVINALEAMQIGFKFN